MLSACVFKLRNMAGNRGGGLCSFEKFKKDSVERGDV